MRESKLQSEISQSVQDAIHLIVQAAQDAGRTISVAAGEAQKIVTEDAANAAKALAMKNIDGASDHDTLNTLVANVSNLKDSQDKFHLEMKESFKDLKDNYSTRLDGLEKTIEINGGRITKLETSKTRQNVMMSIGIGLLTLLTTIVIAYIFK